MRGGGSEQQTLLLLRHLDRSKFEPKLWLAERVGALLPMVPSDVSVDVFAGQPTRLYWPGRMFARSVRSMTKLATQQQIDVVYDQTFGMTLLASAAVDHLGIPRVSAIKSPPERAVPLLEQRFVAIKRRRLAVAYSRSAAIISVSQDAADSAQRFYNLPSGRIQTILNSVDVDRLKSAPVCSSREGIVVVGRMTIEKGHADLLDALRLIPIERLRKWPVRFVGDGPLRDKLRDTVDQFGLSEVITFVGQVADAAPEIASAALLVLPSRFEGFSNVMLEAMALGTAVLATDVGGTSEVSPDPTQPTIVLVPPGEPRAMAGQIERLMQDSFTREQLTQRATVAIEKHYRVGPVVQRIEQVIAGVVVSNDNAASNG